MGRPIISIGTVFFKKEQAGKMEFLVYHSALSLLEMHSFMTLGCTTKLEHSGITLTYVCAKSVEPLTASTSDIFSLLFFPTATQYCDGLRGAFVVYDILDPHRHR